MRYCLRLDPVVARNAPRAPSQDDGRASQTIFGRRPPGPRGRALGREFSSAPETGACRTSRNPPGDAGNNPCRRQGDQVVAPGSTGRGRLVEDDHRRLPPGRRLRTAGLRCGETWRPVVFSQGARPRMGVSVGEGSAGRRLGRARDVRARAPVCARFSPAVAVAGTRPDGRSRVVQSDRLASLDRDACLPIGAGATSGCCLSRTRSAVPQGEPVTARHTDGRHLALAASCRALRAALRRESGWLTATVWSPRRAGGRRSFARR